jgi:hypothetical protein
MVKRVVGSHELVIHDGVGFDDSENETTEGSRSHVNSDTNWRILHR